MVQRGSAITNRSAWKDYVDLYIITNTLPLSVLIGFLKEKMPTLDPLLALKSLAHFDDIVEEPILYKTTPLRKKAVQKALEERVREVVL